MLESQLLIPSHHFAARAVRRSHDELKAAITYFVQAFTVRQTYPDKYDLLMDIATEEFSHLEIEGTTITSEP